MTYALVMNASGDIDHGSSSPVSGGTFTITAVPSVTNFAEGPGVHRGPLAFTFAGGNVAGFDRDSVTGFGVIDPTAVKYFADGLAAIRIGDSVDMTAVGTVSGTPTSVPGRSAVDVTNAGQDKVGAQ